MDFICAMLLYVFVFMCVCIYQHLNRLSVCTLKCGVLKFDASDLVLIAGLLFNWCSQMAGGNGRNCQKKIRSIDVHTQNVPSGCLIGKAVCGKKFGIFILTPFLKVKGSHMWFIWNEILNIIIVFCFVSTVCPIRKFEIFKY